MKVHLRGFTLVEMAIVLVVIGMVLAGGIRVIGPIRDAQRVSETKLKLDLVEQALQVYVIQNGCLPCPADGTLPTSNGDAGLSSDDSGGPYEPALCTADACIATNAVVPWKSLGLSEFDASDAWGNQFRYRVQGTAANGADGVQADEGMTRTGTSDYPTGTLTIDNLDTVASPDSTAAVYVVISSGPDQSLALRAQTGAATANRHGQSGTDGQFLNSGSGATLAEGGLNSTDGAAHFDDIVRWRNAPFVVQRCGANACGNPA